MRSKLKISTLIPTALLAAGVMATNTATAADLLPEPPVIEAPEVVTPVMGRWYLRGDIGYSYRDADNPMFILPDVTGAGGPGIGYNTFSSADFDDSFNLRGGIGYMVNDHFRVEGTVGYSFDSDFSGTTAVAAPCTPVTTLGTTCRSVDEDDYSAFEVMANAYFDLGVYGGFTPYVGAGIGGSYVDYDGLTNQIICVDGAAACAPTDVYPPTQHGGESSWRFAWALHAGFAYSLTTNLKLDVGYTYKEIEEGAMFGIADLQGANTQSGTQGFDKGFEEHRIRAGLRYHFW